MTEPTPSGRCEACKDAPYPWNCERCHPCPPKPTRPAPSGTVTVPVALLDEVDLALRRAGLALVTVASSEPCSDDPRWSPWTRFASPAVGRIDAARKAIREARA